MFMSELTFKDKIRAAASFLISRRNPIDGGWGLNIEKGFQASSIVNTTESLFVINKAGYELDDLEKTIDFLKNSLTDHPISRGDNLRYLTFGLWGLLIAGLDSSDALVSSVAEKIEKRIIDDQGWTESIEDQEVRIWPTFQSFWVLTKTHGRDYVTAKYYKCLAKLISSGRSNSYRWGFTGTKDTSLAATAYVLILLTTLYPDTSDTLQTHVSVIEMLSTALEKNRFLEIEPVAGTDWHHYSYCWALKAIHMSGLPLDERSYLVSLKVLSHIDKLFCDGRGYCEPEKLICNVRSNFNNVLALDAVIENFDPSQYFAFEQMIYRESSLITQKSVFLSFSYRHEDVELVEGFKMLLENAGFIVITGEKNPMGSLSRSILLKIKQTEKCVVVMTNRDKKENGKFTTSSWLLEEKGAAIALGKPCLMLVEDGIDDQEIGGLQGDDQRLHFNRNNFTRIVADAIKMLN
jgi:hypothetical protein